MREILFKAKKLNGSEWVIGSYVHTFNEDKKCPVVGVMTENHWIVEISGNMILIDKETICQYTGLTDKNGNKIWENDIVKHYNNPNEPTQFVIGAIYWNEDNVRYERSSQYEHAKFSVLYDCVYEVIGNIFDNADLLKGE